MKSRRPDDGARTRTVRGNSHAGKTPHSMQASIRCKNSSLLPVGGDGSWLALDGRRIGEGASMREPESGETPPGDTSGARSKVRPPRRRRHTRPRLSSSSSRRLGLGHIRRPASTELQPMRATAAAKSAICRGQPAEAKAGNRNGEYRATTAVQMTGACGGGGGGGSVSNCIGGSVGMGGRLGMAGKPANGRGAEGAAAPCFCRFSSCAASRTSASISCFFMCLTKCRTWSHSATPWSCNTLKDSAFSMTSSGTSCPNSLSLGSATTQASGPFSPALVTRMSLMTAWPAFSPEQPFQSHGGISIHAIVCAWSPQYVTRRLMPYFMASVNFAR
mmetsp:Transcript_3718/g.10300  ORF Transcript_3718/g.10300 Transcript_3718/m.10300 type:complete len:332 (-) Transcript_3718:781-1776(-)